MVNPPIKSVVIDQQSGRVYRFRLLLTIYLTCPIQDQDDVCRSPEKKTHLNEQNYYANI